MLASTFWPAFLFFAQSLCVLAQDPCTITSNAGKFDLRPLIRDAGASDYAVTDPESKDKFYINVCHSVLKEASYGLDESKVPKLGVYREQDGRGQSLSYNTTLRVNSPNSVSLFYKEGSACPLSNRDYSSVITFFCSPKVEVASEPIFAGSPDGCTFLFVWPTSHACPKGRSSGFWYVLGLLLVLAPVILLVYLVGGIAYKRFALGQRGSDQFPSFPTQIGEGLSFIKDLVLISALALWDHVQALASKVTGRRSGGFQGLPQDEQRGLFDAMDDDDVA